MMGTDNNDRFNDATALRLRQDLLSWYDIHARDLPWRSRGSDAANPYYVLLSEVMLQQTTVAHALTYFERFISLWPTLDALSHAAPEDILAQWAGLGYYARARNLIKCAQHISANGGIFPKTQKELLALPGFGEYTSAAFAAFAYGEASNVVDANVERLMCRIFLIKTPMPMAKALVKLKAMQFVHVARARDWPQAMMDLASAICRPKNPLCEQCPISQYCLAYETKTMSDYPVKLKKTQKPNRYGRVYIFHDGSHFIAQRRESKGLLGGMLGLPHTVWSHNPLNNNDILHLFERKDAFDYPPYKHVFTHFTLYQSVREIKVSTIEMLEVVSRNKDLLTIDFGVKHTLPTVFKKAFERLVNS